jgi:hypothetical protein
VTCVREVSTRSALDPFKASVTHRILSALPFLVALGTFTGSSAAAPETKPAADPKKPTLIAGETQRIAGVLKVGGDGAEWALPGGSRLTAGPGTELRVLGVPQPVVLGGGKTVPGYTVLVRSGLVKARVPSTGKSAVVFSAPRKTAVLITSGETSLVAGEHLAVANAEGDASVGSAGEPFRAIQPGTLEVLDDDANLRRTLVSSPPGLRGAFVVVAHADEAPLGEIAWDRVENADGYRAEIRDLGTSRVLRRIDVREPRIAAGSATLAPGKYTLNVVSVDRTGIESSRPVEQALRVIGVTLPAGGYIDASGAVRFPAQTSLPLSNVDGVEMTYGSAQYFMPAPQALELFSGEPRLVRFRVAGSAVDSTLWLVPRDARARIEFGPKAPRWPDAPLQIRIRIEDARGQAAPDFIEARPRVLVGVDRANVEFSRHGEWLHGTLPSRGGKGPWVVRVEVADQNGIALGREFVEIAGTSTPVPPKKGS